MDGQPFLVVLHERGSFELRTFEATPLMVSRC